MSKASPIRNSNPCKNVSILQLLFENHWKSMGKWLKDLVFKPFSTVQRDTEEGPMMDGAGEGMRGIIRKKAKVQKNSVPSYNSAL